MFWGMFSATGLQESSPELLTQFHIISNLIFSENLASHPTGWAITDVATTAQELHIRLLHQHSLPENIQPDSWCNSWFAESFEFQVPAGRNGFRKAHLCARQSYQGVDWAPCIWHFGETCSAWMDGFHRTRQMADGEFGVVWASSLPMSVLWTEW